MILNFFQNIYRKFKDSILSRLKKGNLSEKQVDAIAVKLDIWGTFLVVQSWLGAKQSGWGIQDVTVFTICILVCAILWLIAFIMKGYKNV